MENYRKENSKTILNYEERISNLLQKITIKQKKKIVINEVTSNDLILNEYFNLKELFMKEFNLKEDEYFNIIKNNDKNVNTYEKNEIFIKLKEIIKILNIK
jgi:hypothetical protein